MTGFQAVASVSEKSPHSMNSPSECVMSIPIAPSTL